MRHIVFLITVLATALSASLAAADEVRLKNGDRYSGTVVQLDAGTLTFKTPTEISRSRGTKSPRSQSTGRPS